MTKQEYLESVIGRLVAKDRLSDAAVDRAVARELVRADKAAELKGKRPKPKAPKT